MFGRKEKKIMSKKTVKKRMKKGKPLAIVIKKCPKCSYKWTPRTSSPKVCPRCKCRLDWINK